MSMKTTLASIAALFLFTATVVAQTTKPAEPAWLDPRLKAMPSATPIGPFIELSDGGVMCVKDDAALVTRDDGKSWTPIGTLFPADRKMKVRPEQALIRMKDGTIVCIFLDDLDKQWKWDKQANTHAGDVHLYTYSIRSTDEGKTWTDLVRVQDGYSGAVRDVIETENGNLVLPGQKYLEDKYRHATIPYVSTDKGKTWKATGLLDVGGRGHHDGSIEACVVQLRDKRLWMLLRTNHDYLYQSFSSDDGMSWSAMSPTSIDASSSPAIVKRLKSGRLVLLWNRLWRDGQTDGVRRNTVDAAERQASWQREELAIAFSDDDGKTWTKPAIIARGKRIAYPYVFERAPGVLWVTSMQGDLRAMLNEADFTKDK
jgi:hypothetical protein